MKKLLLAGVALAVLAAPAIAADKRVKVPILKAPVPSPYSWAGLYIGVNAGAAISNSSYSFDPTGCFIVGAGCGTGGLAGNPFRTFANNLHQTAFVGGGQIGYNWQFSPAWVGGVETDINYNGVKQSDAVTQPLGPPIFAPGSFVHTVSQTFDWFGTLRARLGFLASPNWLVYGTGGLAYGHVTSSSSGIFPPPGSSDTYVGSANTVRAGWTAGGGVEVAMGSGWSFKAEYLYIDLGTFSYGDPCVSPPGLCASVTPSPAYTTTITTREHVARVGINHKLDWAAPLVAKH